MKTTSRKCSPAWPPWTTPTNPDPTHASALPRTPFLPKPLNQLRRITLTNLNKLSGQIPVLPLRYGGCRFPGQVTAERIINPARRCVLSPHKPRWVGCRTATSNDGIVAYFFCHLPHHPSFRKSRISSHPGGRNTCVLISRWWSRNRSLSSGGVVVSWIFTYASCVSCFTSQLCSVWN